MATHVQEFLKSSHGKHPLLLLDGRLFEFNRSYQPVDSVVSHEFFRCTRCKNKKLKVTAHEEENDFRILLQEADSHLSSCQPDEQLLVNKMGRQLILDKITESHSSTGARSTNNREIFNEVRDNIPAKNLANFPTFDSLHSAVNRSARANIPNLPTSLDDLTFLPREYTQIESRGDVREFVLFFKAYSCEKDNTTQKLLAFSTEEDCYKLINSERVFCDGTFKVVPFPFSGRAGQLFSLGTLFGEEGSDKYYSRLYVLCSQRTKQMYRLLFRWFFESIQGKWNKRPADCKWRLFTMDFEKALQKTISWLNLNFFQTRPIQFHGCHFHYGQCLWRALQDSGLVVDYHANDVFKKFFKLLLALPFVRSEAVADVYKHILEHNISEPLTLEHAGFLKFNRYFYQQWIAGPKAVPVDNWSCFAIQDSHRTNNHMESEHSVFLDCFGEHPNLWNFCRILITKHARQMDTEAQHEGGQAPNKRRREDSAKEERMKQLRGLYVKTQINSMQYIDALSNLFLNVLEDLPN